MRIATILALLTLAGSAAGEQFWVEYDASCGLFPEECGWMRTIEGGGAVRSLADGILTLDSMADPMIFDYYKMNRPITPGPGETFVATWRVCVAEQSEFWEQLAYFHGDAGSAVVLGYYLDRVCSLYEGWYLPFLPGVFHTYRLESPDLSSYSLWIDDAYSIAGVFHSPCEPVPFVIFGDGTCGTGAGVSRTEWEYFGFGVVPEPSALITVFAIALCALLAQRHA